jgi:hypothetical protein
MDIGDIGDMRTLGVTESYKLKRQVVVSASEAAEMILRLVLHHFIPYYEALIKRLLTTIRTQSRHYPPRCSEKEGGHVMKSSSYLS